MDDHERHDLHAAVQGVDSKLLPGKSIMAYYFKTYNKFTSRCDEYKATNITENVLVAYFKNLSKTKISFTRAMSKFVKLIVVLKRHGEGCQPKTP